MMSPVWQAWSSNSRAAALEPVEVVIFDSGGRVGKARPEVDVVERSSTTRPRYFIGTNEASLSTLNSNACVKIDRLAPVDR
jgi:hypothetical protein